MIGAGNGGLAGVVLAAGRGNRLRPLTDTTAKPLLEVGGTTLLDGALDRVGQVLPVSPQTVAVNAHWLAEQVVAHVDGRVHVSVEQPAALGTAGAIGRLREWIDDRDVLVANGDVWFDRPVDVPAFVDGWDRQRPRLLVVDDPRRADFDGRWRFAGLSLLPWSVAVTLEPVPSGLYEAVWRRVEVDLAPTDATYIDCGTPDDLAVARRQAAADGR